ncbi:ras-responsive element-binding protein 1-like isoform X2 [Saccostrea echinata]|uniref:ras-responsive element-binding protein 1-like isoform X2 n=1 Tax=Saccostrea echinata TaxID=191078 RepID=UPI002A8101DA|nr:ras-responsive element-binding protein 1-like isoform X2 [Saccostrea echinata]
MHEDNGESPLPNNTRGRKLSKTAVADDNGNFIEKGTRRRQVLKKPETSTSKSKAPSKKTDSRENGNMVEGLGNGENGQTNGNASLNDLDDRHVSKEEENKKHKKSRNHTAAMDNEVEIAIKMKSENSHIPNGNAAKEEVAEGDISDGASYDPGSEEEDSNTEMEDILNESSNTSTTLRIEDSDVNEDPFREGSHFEVENGMFKCEFCGVLKTDVTELKTHLRGHTGERPFLCLVCNRAFNAKRTLLYHQFSVHGIEHKSVAARYPDIRKRKFEAGELVDESVIQEVDKKRRKFENEHGVDLVTDPLDNSLPFLVNGVVVENSKKRVCEICKKVCMKPSDLKRHMMSHTGERPFKCEVCGKPFRAKNSMMYHLKSAHGYMVELSPGLEERYLKLKKQSKVPTDKGRSNNAGPYQNNQTTVSPNLSPEGNPDQAVFPTASTNHPVAYMPLFKPLQMHGNGETQTFYNCSSNSFKDQPDESSGHFKQKDMEFESVNPKIFAPRLSLNVPKLVKPGGNPVGKEIHQIFSSGSCDIKVDSETVLVTRLDGTLSTSGQKVCAYKCHLCGKLFNYLSKVQFHLSFHFEREIKTYHCKHCSASFPFQFQMHRHLRKCHSRVISKDLSTSATDPSSTCTNSTDLTSATSLAEHFSVLRFKRNDNESYACMICKKSFCKESSLLKHIKMHSNHDFCYCRDCGHGFSDYEFLKEHFEREHKGRDESHHHVKTEESCNTLLSHLLKKTSGCGKGESQTEVVIDIESQDVEERKAKEMLERAGIGDEVTVVLPCDPEDEGKVKEKKSDLKDWQEEEEEKSDFVSSSEIQTAPKMSLLAKVPGKSKRKASQPVRLNQLNGAKLESDADQEEEIQKGPEELEPVANIKVEEDKESIDKINYSSPSSISRSSSPAKSPTSSDVDYKLPTALPASGFWPPHLMPNAQFPHSLLATGQMLQAIAATGHITSPTSLAQALTNPAAQAMLASGQMPTIAQALASSSHIPATLAKTMTSASSQFMPPGLASTAAFMHPSFPFSQIYAFQAAAAAALQQSKLNNNVNKAGIKTEMIDNLKLESSDPADANCSSPGAPLDLATTSSLDAKNSNSPSTSSAGNMSDGSIRLPDDMSPNTSTQGEPAEDYRDGLVGMPKVQWSPGDPNSPFSWHHMTTDGRKVTSLSRTHSRLPIVNSPVNRDQICKPTTLDDGRQVFSCPFCSKNFSSYSDINRHMDFHEDIRPYKCKYCEYYARTNSQLKVHMMRHQGIREFCCKVCNYKGVTQSDLNRHMKSQIHMLKSRNECTYCGEGFVTAKNLEKHLDGNCIVKVQQEKGEYLF